MALRELGYVEGGNLVIERRFSEGKLDRLRGLAHELVQRRVEVIVAVSSAIDAAKDATVTIPSSWASATTTRSAGGTWRASPALRATSPASHSRRALCWPANGWSCSGSAPAGRADCGAHTGEPGSSTQVQEAQKAASALGSRSSWSRCRGRTTTAPSRRWRRSARTRSLSSPVPFSTATAADHCASRAVQAARDVRVREQVEAGGLMSYGSSVVALSRRVAAHVDKLSRALDRPAFRRAADDIELVINQKTAEALGLRSLRRSSSRRMR